jgi:hypothetical protein
VNEEWGCAYKLCTLMRCVRTPCFDHRQLVLGKAFSNMLHVYGRCWSTLLFTLCFAVSACSHHKQCFMSSFIIIIIMSSFSRAGQVAVVRHDSSARGMIRLCGQWYCA